MTVEPQAEVEDDPVFPNPSPNPFPALVHLIHCRSPDPFIPDVASFIATTTLVHSLLLFFCRCSPPPDSFTTATTCRLILLEETGESADG